MDISQFQFNKMFADGDLARKVAPGSLLDSFLKQDETAYTSASSSPLPVDQVFVNSRALLSIASDAWSEHGDMSVTGVMKEEAKQSMMSVIHNLENGDLCSVLQNLDVDDSELMQWENALSRLSQSENHCVASQLESLFTSDIFDCIDSILFKGNGENLNGAHPSLFDPQQEPAAAGLCEPPWFPTPSPECTYPPCAPTQTFSNTRKLSHLAPGREAAPPQLAGPQASATFQSCRQVHVGHPPEPSQQPRQMFVGAHTAPQPDGELQQSAVEPQLTDLFSPLVSCADFWSPACNVPVCFSSECVKNSPPLQTCNRQVQEWQQRQLQVPPAGVKQNGHEQTPARHSLTSGGSGLWQSNGPRLTPGQQGGLARSRAAAQSSCMFAQRFSGVAALSGPSGPRWAEVHMDQSPPQGSCYFQWGPSEPVVGSSAISQEDVSVSPLSRPATLPSAEHAFNIQPYLCVSATDRYSAPTVGCRTVTK